MSVPVIPGWNSPLAKAGGFCSRFEITRCIFQVTPMCSFFTRDLCAVGTKRHDLLLRTRGYSACFARTSFTIFCEKAKPCEQKCLQITSRHTYVKVHTVTDLGQSGDCSLPQYCQVQAVASSGCSPRLPACPSETRHQSMHCTVPSAAVTIAGYCLCLCEILARSELVKRELEETCFCTWTRVL